MNNEELNGLQSEAYEHLWSGRHRLALNAAEKVYEYRPDDSEAAVCLAWAYLENGNPTKAMEYANLAVELKGDSAKTRMFRAYLLTRMSIFEGAIADIEKTADKERKLLSWTYLTKARALAGIKKFEEANNAVQYALLIDNTDKSSIASVKSFFEKAALFFTSQFTLNDKNIDSFINDIENALKAKEYWFVLFGAQKILESGKFKNRKDEADLLELEAMYYLFQYRPALKKAETMKSKFKKNDRFNQIYNLLLKFILREDEEFERDKPKPRKTDTSIEMKRTGSTIASEDNISFKTNAIFYPNEYSNIFSAKIYDALKDIRQKKRIYYRQIDNTIPSAGVEIIFNNPFYKKEDHSFDCYAVWYLNDFEIGRNNFRLNVPRDWDSVIFSQTMGNEKPGFWSNGQAKVEIYINNFKVCEKLFGINNKKIEEIDEIHEQEQEQKQYDIDSKAKTQQLTTQQDTRTLEELLAELDSYVGLSSIKQSVRDFISYLEFIKERKRHGLKTDDKISINAIFLGNPGSGKTTIARLLGNIFRAMGILPSGHVIEVDRAGIVGQYIGETAQKTEKVINDAIGGILFIDEAYTLIKKGGSGQDFGQEAIDILLKRMEDRKGEFVVIAAGYPDEMNSFLNSNPGLKSRFSHTFSFEDYSPDELLHILQRCLKNEEYCIQDDAVVVLRKELINLYRSRDKSFGNARLIRNIFEESKITLSKRVLNIEEKKRTKELLNTITADDINSILKKSKEKQFAIPINEELLEESLKELENLVGLTSVKKEINDLVKLARFFAEEGDVLRDKFGSHYLFLGNPGTGKTTVARIFSKIFSALGIIEKGHLVETDRQGLVAGYVGQTAEKTTTVIDRSIGGTLFIDEAYALVKSDNSGNDFGKETIDILLKRMEDERGKFIVIAAGYTDEMKRFIASNPGMESRFSKSITFEDYNPKELMEIVQRSLSKDKKVLAGDAETTLLKHFEELYKIRDKKFGNARIVRNILETVKQKLLLRIADLPQSERTEEKLNTIILDDIKEALTVKQSANEYQVKGDPLKLQEYIDDLNSLVGLDNVKEEIFKLISGSKIAQLKKERGLQVFDRNLNSVFIGPQGTGKNTVAKLLSKILKELGMIEKDQIIKVKRPDLIGSYFEQTAHKTESVVKEALGGILYIEEAYTLIQSGDHSGLDVIETLLTKIEEFRNKLIVILEGPNDQIKSFLDSFPLLKTRFPNNFIFEDYSPRQMLSITYDLAENLGYSLDEGALQILLEIFTDYFETRKESYKNARTAKSILYEAISKQEQRIARLLNPTDEDLRTITLDDVHELTI